MAERRTAVLTGGCQCGAVRYALYGEPISGDICHCRMCQRALGNLFGTFAGIGLGDFAWISGAPATWQSSSVAERGFCGRCGTPLSFRYLGRDKISVMVGSLDEPERARPTEQLGIESRVSWLDDALTRCPASAPRTTRRRAASRRWSAIRIRAASDRAGPVRALSGALDKSRMRNRARWRDGQAGAR